MTIVIDTLLLGPDELEILRLKYPACEVVNQTDSQHKIQQYKVAIPDVTVDSYHDFLLESCFPMSSSSFLLRIKQDEKFAKSTRQKMFGRG
jgi:hypothetical protein